MVSEEREISGEILIVEDDVAIARLMELYLKKEGFSVAGCTDGGEAIRLMQENIYRLVILDRMLPGKRGMEILRWIRKQDAIAATPVLMVTALGSTEEKVHGLKEGADDYLPKPFEPEELVARVNALLRRAATVNKQPNALGIGDILLDADAMEVTINGKVLDLRPLEFKLLQVLMKKPGKVRSREYLLDHVWGINSFVELRTVDVTVKRLRKTLDEHGFSDAIKTIRGAGYRFTGMGKGGS
ncbi:MAG TPA: response regulator transcription factor [Mariprofundaceae bacterium]|nr:response regulator transcription factor [Mariprofundaceae bacterium]